MVAPDRFIGCTDHGTNLYLCGGFSILEHQHRLHCNFHYGSTVHIFATYYLDRHDSMFQGDADFQSVVDDNESFKSADDEDAQSFYSANDKRAKGRPSGSRDGLGVERPNKKQIDELIRINEEIKTIEKDIENQKKTEKK
jgi:hypothetical protein